MRIIEEKEFVSLVNKLENPVDQFLILGVYYGLLEKHIINSSLIYIKKKDVDFSTGEIKLENRNFVMNELFKEVVYKATNQSIYIKKGGGGGSADDFLFNPKSQYIIRTKPLRSNEYGLYNISLDGFKTRLKYINRFIETKFTISHIKRFGAYNLLSKQNEKLTLEKAIMILQENGLGIRRAEVSKFLADINGND